MEQLIWPFNATGLFALVDFEPWRHAWLLCMVWVSLGMVEGGEIGDAIARSLFFFKSKTTPIGPHHSGGSLYIALLGVTWLMINDYDIHIQMPVAEWMRMNNEKVEVYEGAKGQSVDVGNINILCEYCSLASFVKVTNTIILPINPRWRVFWLRCIKTWQQWQRAIPDRLRRIDTWQLGIPLQNRNPSRLPRHKQRSK